MFCRYCGRELNGAKFCPQCGKPAPAETKAEGNIFEKTFDTFTDTINKVTGGDSNAETKTEGNVFEKTLDSFTETINKMTGGEGKVELKIKDLYSEVFIKHDNNEAEEILLSGGAKSAPKPEDISKTWPKPWIYSRVFVVMLLTAVVLAVCCSFFENLNAYPGLMAVGSFAVPVSILVLFFEMNAPRNISIVKTAMVFVLGGAFSLVATLFLFSFFEMGEMDTVVAIMTGIIEECGKAAIVAFCLNKMKNCKYILNGLLIGAAVGAGFAAFESAGYAFNFLLQYGYETMIQVILLRGGLAFGGHVAWAAIEGAAMIIAAEGKPFEAKMLGSKKFLAFFALPVILHAIWDMPFLSELPYNMKYIALCVVVWIILLVLISAGMREINNLTAVSVINKDDSEEKETVVVNQN